METMNIFRDSKDNKDKIIYEAYKGSLGDVSFIRKLEDVEINDELAKTMAKELGMSKPTEFFRNTGV